MKIQNTLFKTTLGAIVALGMVSTVAAAECPEGFPGKNVEFWVGYGAGGGTDLISRALASEIEEAQGWNISVTNKPGAGSSVMMTQLAEAEPNGLTIGLTSTGSISKVPNRNPNSPYTITDFSFIGTAQQTPVSLAALTDGPFHTYEEMIAYAKEKGRLTISSGATDTNIFFDVIQEREGIRIVIVPSKGTAGSLQQILGGHVDAALLGSGHVQHLESGRMEQIFTLGSQRPLFAPDAPTSVELGYNFVGAVSYVLIAAPDGIEPAKLTCLEQVLDEAVTSEGFAELQKSFNQKALNLGPDGATKLLESEFALFKDYYAAKRAAAN